MIEHVENLAGRPLAPAEVFHFHCHPQLSCFNSCCRGKRLPLLPYDLLRLRRGLAQPSAAVLEKYAELEIDLDSGWPVLRLRLLDDGRCPFVGQGGCQVYAHRPTCCRVFPLVRAFRPAVEGRPAEEVFLISEPRGCLGLAEPPILSVERWIADQGLRDYQRANNRASALFLHPSRSRPMILDEHRTHAVILGLYNLDVFREALGRPGCAEQLGLDEARVARAVMCDEALLELGEHWLAGLLFGAAR